MLGPGEDAPAGEPTVSPLPDSRHALAEAQEQGARGRQRLCSWSKDLSAREQHRRESNVALSPMSSPLLPLPSEADFASLGGPSCPLPTTSLDEAHVEETGIPCQAAEVPSHAQEAPTGLSASPSQMQERFNKDLEEIKKSQYIMNNAINEIKNSLEGSHGARARRRPGGAESLPNRGNGQPQSRKWRTWAATGNFLARS